LDRKRAKKQRRALQFLCPLFFAYSTETKLWFELLIFGVAEFRYEFAPQAPNSGGPSNLKVPQNWGFKGLSEML
jgi:hypothetical protein